MPSMLLKEMPALPAARVLMVSRRVLSVMMHCAPVVVMHFRGVLFFSGNRVCSARGCVQVICFLESSVNVLQVLDFKYFLYLNRGGDLIKMRLV